MATKTLDEAKPQAGADQPATEKGKSRAPLGRNLKIAGLVALIIAAEVGATWFYMSPAPVKAAAAKADPEARADTTADDDADIPTNTAEIQIGSGFSCTNSKATDGTVHIDFKLHVLVAANQKDKFDAKKKEHEFRIRQAIDKVARSSNLDDLNDPNLSTMKRLIREEINKILHKSYVTDVVISDFTTMEQ